MNRIAMLSVVALCACTPKEQQIVLSDVEVAARDAVSCVLQHVDLLTDPKAPGKLAALCGPSATADVVANTFTAYAQAKIAAGSTTTARVTLVAEGGAP